MILIKANKKRIKGHNFPENFHIDLYLDEGNLVPMKALEADEK